MARAPSNLYLDCLRQVFIMKDEIELLLYQALDKLSLGEHHFMMTIERPRDASHAIFPVM